MLSNHDVELSLQATLKIGGRGLDSITAAQKRKNAYHLAIDTREGERNVIKLDMDEHTLGFYGDTRVPPYVKLELSSNAANNLRREIEDTFDVERRD